MWLLYGALTLRLLPWLLPPSQQQRPQPSHPTVNHGALPHTGSVLMPTAHRGNDTAPPFITVPQDATVQGFVIFHVHQSRDDAEPVPYPFAVALTGNNAAVTDVECLCCWNAISAVQAHRHYIARVQGQPANIGVYVDEVYDIGRIEDVHFNPWYSNTKTYMRWQLTHGEAFVFG